ncbi:hypothetical protein AGMMS49975_00040 [Clostridia bacterium]|nr:hypothetical protein AGMMS49975_00040 [Clostridia bacterium]
MILSEIKYLKKYLPKHKKKIMRFINEMPKDIADGEYPIAGEKVFARVMSYDTKPENECKIESHKKYVDIQCTLAGVEGIGIFDRKLTPKDEYDKDNDVIFYEPGEPLYTAAVNAGYFAMIFPNEPHRPQTYLRGDIGIRKFVIKIDKGLF